MSTPITVKLPVPIEVIHHLEREGGGLPKLGSKLELTADFMWGLGLWTVDAVEYAYLPPDYVTPVYWLTLTCGRLDPA